MLEQEKIALFFSFIDQRIKTQIKRIEDLKVLQNTLIDYYYHHQRYDKNVSLFDCISQTSERNKKKIMALRVGSGLPNIQKKDLMSLRIPIPAKENQKKISCLLDSIEDKISIETNMLKHDIRQKNYLLRQMFI